MVQISPEKLQLCQQCSLSMIARRLVAVAATAAAISLQGIKNFRPLRGAASSLPVYRCAALDGATPADVIALASIDGKRLGRVIDLRNDDEIGKGRANRTAAATDFYQSIRAEELLINRPLLGDIDGFWGAVADQAPPLPVFPKIAMLWSSRPLDEALSRALEDGGLAMLYTCILASAPKEVGRAVDDVIASAVDKGEAVVFHCAKGKDRTGIVAALVESVCGVPRSEIVAGYAASGALLGGDDAPGAADEPRPPSSGGVDWGRFRGSPAAAIEAALDWIDKNHGSPAAYLEACGVDAARQKQLRDAAL